MSIATYDAIIVGGGPAGSTCASVLVKHGVRTLLLDKAEFPRVKLCAGCSAFRKTLCNSDRRRISGDICRTAAHASGDQALQDPVCNSNTGQKDFRAQKRPASPEIMARGQDYCACFYSPLFRQKHSRDRPHSRNEELILYMQKLGKLGKPVKPEKPEQTYRRQLNWGK